MTAGRTSIAEFSSCSRRRSGVVGRRAVAVRVECVVVYPERGGRGAGRTQGGVLAVTSVDASRRLHIDANLGPVELGAGASPLRWFHSVGAGIAFGRYGLATELYGFTAGAGEWAEWGALGAVTVRPAEWIVVDAGGSIGLWRETPHLVFVGVTTNLGKVFK